MGARCRTLSGIRDEGAIHDISEHGCCVTMRALCLSVGNRVVVKPDGLEGIFGVVRWIAGGKAGIEFEQPLYGPIVEHLSQRHRPSGSVALADGR
ncbi:MAG: PilZ domain-containing protein [Sphingomonadales bacterium]|nr:PilZ domain-containing protein [Sphingomonadales bacterium]